MQNAVHLSKRSHQHINVLHADHGPCYHSEYAESRRDPQKEVIPHRRILHVYSIVYLPNEVADRLFRCQLVNSHTVNILPTPKAAPFPRRSDLSRHKLHVRLLHHGS